MTERKEEDNTSCIQGSTVPETARIESCLEIVHHPIRSFRGGSEGRTNRGQVACAGDQDQGSCAGLSPPQTHGAPGKQPADRKSCPSNTSKTVTSES